MTRVRDLVLSGALAVGAIALTLGLLEAGLRLEARAGATRAERQRGSLGATVPAPGSRARLGQIIRISPNPRIVYELVPNLDVVFVQAPLVTNAEGFRGSSVPLARAPRTVRVVGLGDSVMFGWGVRWEDSYLARLQAELTSDFPGVSWEVVNTAVPGYNTAMEVETLEEKGLRYRPDLVILNFVGNDLGLPNFLVAQPDPLALDRSFLLDLVRSRLDRARGSGGLRLTPVPADVRRLGLDGASSERVPPAYRDMVGLDAWRREMERLAVLARAHGFEVVVLVHPEAPAFVKATCDALGFPVVETAAALRDYERRAGVGPEDESPLVLTPADPHPSPLGHQIIARVLGEYLKRSGLSRRLVARRGGPGS
jgi:lysophospholipase L1-like esterase